MRKIGLMTVGIAPRRPKSMITLRECTWDVRLTALFVVTWTAPLRFPPRETKFEIRSTRKKW
jgi:hypothetical protein